MYSTYKIYHDIIEGYNYFEKTLGDLNGIVNKLFLIRYTDRHAGDEFE